MLYWTKKNYVPLQGGENERDHTCRRKRYEIVPADQGDIEAAASDL